MRLIKASETIHLSSFRHVYAPILVDQYARRFIESSASGSERRVLFFFFHSDKFSVKFVQYSDTEILLQQKSLGGTGEFAH
jgi:hypothetical protein